MLYYYINVWIIIVYDYVILKTFYILSKIDMKALVTLVVNPIRVSRLTPSRLSTSTYMNVDERLHTYTVNKFTTSYT
jgi:hypothetical protein